MIQELIGRVFAARDIAHRAHWRTTSYSENNALNKFYESLPDHIDGIVETHQGLLGLVDPEIVLAEDPENLLVWMKSEADWIEANRELIAMGSNAVANLIDGLTGLYLTTIYKLENLK